MVRKNRNFQFNRFYCIAIPTLWYANIMTPVLKLSNTCFPLGWIMVFKATFNNISVISWWSVLLMEETGVPGETQTIFKSKG